MVHDLKFDKVNFVISLSTSYLSCIEWRNTIEDIDFFLRSSQRSFISHKNAFYIKLHAKQCYPQTEENTFLY